MICIYPNLCYITCQSHIPDKETEVKRKIVASSLAVALGLAASGLVAAAEEDTPSVEQLAGSPHEGIER